MNKTTKEKAFGIPNRWYSHFNCSMLCISSLGTSYRVYVLGEWGEGGFFLLLFFFWVARKGYQSLVLFCFLAYEKHKKLIVKPSVFDDDSNNCHLPALPKLTTGKPLFCGKLFSYIPLIVYIESHYTTLKLLTLVTNCQTLIMSVQYSSIAQLCPTLCDTMDHSTPGLPVHHQLPEFTQTHVH